MTDERREYQEMVSTMKLSDEKGEMLLGEAKKRLVSHKKIKKTLLTVLAIVIGSLGLGSGVIYAATGNTPLAFFATMFRQADNELISIFGEEFEDEDQVIVSDNWRITLDQYWFDREKGKLMAVVIWETVDGEPLVDMEFMSHIKRGNRPITLEEWGDAESYLLSCDQFYRLRFSAGGSYRFHAEELSKMVIYINAYMYESDFWDSGLRGSDVKLDVTAIEKGFVREAGSFELENTGEWKKRELEPANVKSCKRIVMDGMELEMELTEQLDRNNPHQVEICLKDGTVMEATLGGSWARDYFFEKEEGIYGCSYEFNGDMIDVDKVEKVIIDGVELSFLD